MTQTFLIHIVDDDEPVRTALQFALEASGLRVVTYVDASDFLARGIETRGVLICDVRMAGLSGVELARRLRQGGASMPIILTTGHADRALREEAIKAGAEAVFEKPVSLSVLLAEIARLTAIGTTL